MRKILITGFSGFVSHHFLEYLYQNDIKTEIIGVDIREPLFNYKKFMDKLKISFRIINLLDKESIKSMLCCFSPDYILHLASYSSVAYSWKYPEESFVNNTNIFLNIISSIAEANIKCRILSVGSSEEYGNVLDADMPLREDHILLPVSPYAVARVAQEMLAKVYVESYGMDIILTRSFNHIGPWQDERFVIPSFIKKIKRLKDNGVQEGIIETGDISIVRDFVDVRDVVKAYYVLLTEGTTGSIYNICSGVGVSLKDVIGMIAMEIGVKIDTKINPELVRPNDNRIIVGSYEKIYNDFGWEPKIPILNTIHDMI